MKVIKLMIIALLLAGCSKEEMNIEPQQVCETIAYEVNTAGNTWVRVELENAGWINGYLWVNHNVGSVQYSPNDVRAIEKCN